MKKVSSGESATYTGGEMVRFLREDEHRPYVKYSRYYGDRSLDCGAVIAAVQRSQLESKTQDAVRDYIEKRTNGSDQDSPDRAFPQDGATEWIRYADDHPDSYFEGSDPGRTNCWYRRAEYLLRYTEGPLDRAWMEERDKNYVFRLEREGCLDKKERLLSYEVPALYLEITLIREQKKLAKERQAKERQAKERQAKERQIRQSVEKYRVPKKRSLKDEEKLLDDLLEEEERLLNSPLAEEKEFKPLAQPTSFQTIPDNQLLYTKNDIIGRGSFGVVYKGTWKATGSRVAIKQLAGQNTATSDLNAFRREGEIMFNMRHENIAVMYGMCLDPGKISIVMEYFPKLSLFHLLRSKDELPWGLRWSIALDISQGLSYLHHRKTAHRDLKSLNVLIDDRGRAKLTDFGLAKMKTVSSATTPSNKVVGTLRWMAPEIFKRGATRSLPADIYSLGMVFWELASRKLPFEEEADNDIVRGWIISGEKEKIPLDCQKNHVAFAALILLCWQAPEKRPAANSAVGNLMALQGQYNAKLGSSSHVSGATSSGFAQPSFQPT